MDTTTATYREILDALRAAGYTGPHSYSKSRLAVVANEFFTGNPAVPAAVEPKSCTCTAEDTGSAHWNGCPLEAKAADEVDEAIAGLTKLGRAMMQQIGERRFSFFDNGIQEDSGIWGECLAGEFTAGSSPRSSAGVMTRLRTAGMLKSYNTGDPSDPGDWWDLTALGAKVARRLGGLADDQI
jgi:hypothetical protein